MKLDTGRWFELWRYPDTMDQRTGRGHSLSVCSGSYVKVEATEEWGSLHAKAISSIPDRYLFIEGRHRLTMRGAFREWPMVSYIASRP